MRQESTYLMIPCIWNYSMDRSSLCWKKIRTVVAWSEGEAGELTGIREKDLSGLMEVFCIFIVICYTDVSTVKIVQVIFRHLNICNIYLKKELRASLMVQWLRIHFAMQGTPVWSLVWEDATCHGASNPEATTLSSLCSRACEPQLPSHVPVSEAPVS